MTTCPYLPWNQTNSANKRTVAIVVGAGIAGVSTCYSLIKRGFKVILIDQEEQAGSHASGNHAGLLMPAMTTVPSTFSEYYIQAFNHSIKQAHLLAESYEFGFKPSGIIQLAFNERQQIRQTKWLEIDEYSYLLDYLDQTQIKKISGLPFPYNGILFKNAAWLSPIEFVAAYLNDIKESITTIFNQKATKIHYENEEWNVFNSSEKLLATAPVLIIANAIGGKELIKDIPMSIRSVRGQLSMISNNPTMLPLKIPVSYDGYLVPAKFGNQWIGASFSEMMTKDCLVQDRRYNIKQLENIYPEFSHDETSYNDITQDRAAFRCISSDYFPLVGPVPCGNYFRKNYLRLIQDRKPSSYPPAHYLPGLYMNLAHGSRGMISAPFASELLAREICGEPLDISLKCREYIHPGRFLIRQLKKGVA
ncbi:MAG: FAD-dependent 5-carboxymethylaminomethyl-2-thiouridine(34) oxidoreductase MnmC [Francisellaceae bacterium]|jgi:tRNA 5-methylaminomethyl-2-thiouridine biosynthesis bifunctional protein|nr:FAD-dependent 5-carboxymethylaminomethyl-2-thiouridine(34) oxidoreductase MnmC [Francisellaceae bacterium]MBT6538579.1 FAD-dependent 5-carboxymethylaminomethyl-2-thiouridine(34) oxidoreductase MnmC [Francisellaceae bacterium]